MCDNKNDSPKYYKSTPPQTNKKVRNPFDRALIEKLHKPLCSPSMCKVYKKKHKSPFRWDIDQACTLVPADIIVCNSQYEPSPDPMLEKIAEEATERFFSQEMVMPSPIESSKKVKPLLQVSAESSLQICTVSKEATVVMKDAQTVLTLPPELPPALEKLLEPFCTFTHDQNISGDYEITANGSLRRKLLFEEHSDVDQYDDSEHTDDEIVSEQRPASSFGAHTPVVFSPDPDQSCLAKGIKRTFGTPLASGAVSGPCYRNKILDVVDFGEPCFSPIQFETPQRTQPVTSSSVEHKQELENYESPESETMATCLNCISNESEDKKGPCFCKATPNKSLLKRSTSLKESPPVHRKVSATFPEKRSLSMTSLNRSRSVQKLDFSMDMSVDGSFLENSQDVEPSPIETKKPAWSTETDVNIQDLVSAETIRSRTDVKIASKTQITFDETPLKAKLISKVRSHSISKIRSAITFSPGKMSLDASTDCSENPLSLEDKRVDFSSVDLKFLTDSQFDYTTSDAPKVHEATTSLKRLDSGINENTFYGSASSYYESAIKPSELTITTSNMSSHKTALKEISNVHWMRFDSGFRDENSGDSMQFYPTSESTHKISSFSNKLQEKENSEEPKAMIHDGMSMSQVFADDMAFNCNFSSTPSKSKSRKALA